MAGLGMLAPLDQILIFQKVELFEVFTGMETKNMYKIMNNTGHELLYGKEMSGCCGRICCGPIREFHMNIVDNSGNEVIHLYRPLNCKYCCFPCCLQKMEVSAPPGTVIGYIVQEWSIWTPKFRIVNESKQVVLRIKGPLCTFNICGDVKFQVLSADGKTVVGLIGKQWSGLAKEAFTDADNFGITFPKDLDVRMKAVMLGACFLIVRFYILLRNDPGINKRRLKGLFPLDDHSTQSIVILQC